MTILLHVIITELRGGFANDESRDSCRESSDLALSTNPPGVGAVCLIVSVLAIGKSCNDLIVEIRGGYETSRSVSEGKPWDNNRAR